VPKRGREGEERKEVPLPDNKETMLGVIQQFLGYDRARVLCADGKVRLCRIPGRLKKRMWMKVGDVVLVAPWEFQRDERGDIIYRYSGGELQELEEKGFLAELKRAIESAGV
jgi:translation initiation factor 1A